MLEQLAGSVFLGWALGANDAANVFGTAVTSRMVKFYQAAILASVFVIVGALLEGAAGMETLSGLSSGQTITSASLITISTAIAVAILTLLRLPISTSQAAVGAILGMTVSMGNAVHWKGLVKVVVCWVGTPIGSAVLSFLLYYFIRFLIRRFKVSFIWLDGYLRLGMIIAGCYGAYALGANNVANVVGIFKGLHLMGLEGGAEARFLALVGGISISLGICTFSYRVMLTVGKSLYDLDAFAAFIAVSAQALTVHFYAKLGVPVSSSQAIIGGVLGVVAVKGFHVLHTGPFLKILSGWIATPIVAGLVSFLAGSLFV